MSKQESIQKFSDEYQNEKESIRTQFTKICHKLLQQNYITGRKSSDFNDYNFAINYKSLFENYFAVLDFEIIIDRPNQYIYMRNEDYNQLKLNRNETVVLLELRLIYQNKMEQASLTDDIYFDLGELHNNLTIMGYNQSKRLPKEKMTQILQLFKSYSLIDFVSGSNFSDDLTIKIYPSIIGACNIDNLQELANKIDSYVQPENIESIEIGGENEIIEEV